MKVTKDIYMSPGVVTWVKQVKKKKTITTLDHGEEYFTIRHNPGLE